MNGKKMLAGLWQAWKRIGRAIGDLIGRLVLTVFYFTIFAPFGLGMRVLRRGDSQASAGSGHWIRREAGFDDLTRAKRLY
ncbi:MAG: hypothetical protein WD906_06750 [Anaerolineales bacterium]